MKSIIAIGLLFAGVFAGPQLERRACNHDNCLRAFIASSAVVAPFCSTYTTGPASATLPAWASACSNLPLRVSSACSCINTATSTTSQSSTTSSAAPTSTTSSVSPTSTSSAAPTSTSSSTTSTTSTTSTSTSTNSSAAASTSTTPPWTRTTPPSGAIIVYGSDTFTPGIYPTVQEGVDALSPSTSNPQVLFIYPGTYVEQVYVPALKSNLTIQGYTLDSRSYEGNTVTITFNLALENVTSDDLTATVRQWNPNTKVYNLNIANTFGHISTNGQNLALSAHTNNQGYYGMQLLGYQDTLLANTGNQLYAKSLIVGAVDFIFGQTATAWLDQVDIRTIAKGSVTASGRASNTTSYYVINNSTVDGINSSIPAGDNSLGRPWGAWARVAFQYTYLGDVITPAGWSIWSTSTPNTANASFGEYQNYGPGSYPTEGPRANFSKQLTSPVLIGNILGQAWEDEWWVDLSYVQGMA